MRRKLGDAKPAAEAAKAEPPKPKVDKGDTTWMLTATALVILMTIPGLALFYAGMVRAKNVLSVLMHVFMCFCLIAVLWVVYGYSIAFSGGNAFFGGFSKMFSAGSMPTRWRRRFPRASRSPSSVSWHSSSRLRRSRRR